MNTEEWNHFCVFTVRDAYNNYGEPINVLFQKNMQKHSGLADSESRIILLDTKLELVPYELALVVYYHELFHIKNNHWMNAKWYMGGPMSKKRIELLADIFGYVKAYGWKRGFIEFVKGRFYALRK